MGGSGGLNGEGAKGGWGGGGGGLGGRGWGIVKGGGGAAPMQAPKMGSAPMDTFWPTLVG